MKTQHFGFTLVELMVTIVLMAILLGVAVPSFNTTIRNNRLVAHAHALVGTLNSARAEAIAQKRTVTVCGSTNGASCGATAWVDGWMSFIDESGDAAYDAAEDTILRIVDSAPQDVELTFSGGTVRYNSLGFATTGSAGTFLLCDPRGDQFARAVLVSPTGRVSIATDTDDSGVVNDASGSDVSCPEE
jgi:type IV fimbrial biogenesis protein FimT